MAQFLMPDAGEGLTEAEVVEWRVAVGEHVEVNQTLVEIETAKSSVELPSPWSGTVLRLLVEPGVTVDVGTPIVEIETGADVPAADRPPESSAGPVHVPPTHAGAARAWAEPGGSDEIEAAGPVPVERDSSSGAPAPGPSDAPISRAVAAPASPAGATGVRAASGGAGTASTSAPAPSTSGSVLVGYGVAEPTVRRPRLAGTPHVLAKPPVRKLARDLGVDLDTVAPTGPGGIVTREDLLAHVARAQPQTLATYAADDLPWLASGVVSPDGRQTRVPVRSVRKRTAEAMVASAFTAPHVTVFHTVDVTRTMRLVTELRADREFADVRVTPLLVAAKALLIAVRRHPEINASWDDAAQEIVYKHYVNLGIAAATPRGLVVPNIKDAHRLGLHDLARALGELTGTAREGRSTPADLTDGTVTITNVGVFGIDSGTPILNPGEAAILAFGSIREQPWVHKGKVRPRQVTQLALSFDHRLVDGELGSRVLADVARILQDPARGLVWG